ncbi:GNAT family N-acetyltransferase [Glycomyces sp. TRM65418]|uniref:GNAT family N-acetyltransferase n=1 Tax=Glycomyces sp. TRM65418 TaxID=2867006 RepID=UPI001CE704D8|nr:GNAT family N-acetyltransferase [Glycomyces sp. TRM65418]MCC3761635.1 GNAT family N-acetyltransferase [Glycomyces sp. TRM65418]QZD55729.1 GNAT family N-acetyltransferase [Glycomyces sp. TRM65418]
MSAPDVHSIPDLVMAWGRGRAVSRLTAPPAPVPGGFEVAVGRPSREIRQVFHTYTAESLAAAAERLSEPGRQIMIAGPRDLLRESVPATWTMDAAGHLMTVGFAPTRYEVPDGYRLSVETEGALTVARAFYLTGDLAASARLGRDGAFGVFDKVVTDPAHRRRGLGATLMRALTGHAVALGMQWGLLVGSDDGRALYEHLGWTFVSDFPGVRSKGD